MEEKLRKHFETIIADQTSDLNADIKRLKELTKPIAPDKAIGRLSRLEAMNDKSVQEANLRKAERRLVQLRAAAERVKTDAYGLCLRCEEEIPQKRLELLPETTICMDCVRES